MKKLIIILIIIIAIISGIFIYKKYQETQPFLLASEGSTATTWLSTVLNSIPEINCTHYNHIHSDKAAAPINLTQMSMTDYFQLLKENAADKPLYGNVHGFILKNILNNKSDVKPRVANLIRHPIAQIDSMHHYWLRTKETKAIVADFIVRKEIPDVVFAESFDQYTPNFNEALKLHAVLKEQYHFDIPNDVNSWAFLIIMGRYNRVHNDILMADAKRIPQFKFEEYTTDPRVLAKMIKYISRGKVTMDHQQITELLATPASNINNTVKQSPAQIYATWAPWQRKAFELHLAAIGGIKRNAYTQVGYDLSFVAL